MPPKKKPAEPQGADRPPVGSATTGKPGRQVSALLQRLAIADAGPEPLEAAAAPAPAPAPSPAPAPAPAAQETDLETFPISRIKEQLGVDDQFLGELVGIARAEIPSIITQASRELEEMSVAMEAVAQMGERYLWTLHRLQENISMLSMDAMAEQMPSARGLVVPMAIVNQRFRESSRGVVDSLNQEFAQFDVVATSTGFPRPPTPPDAPAKGADAEPPGAKEAAPC